METVYKVSFELRISADFWPSSMAIINTPETARQVKIALAVLENINIVRNVVFSIRRKPTEDDNWKETDV